MVSNLLELSGIGYSLGTKQILTSIDLTLEAGNIDGLVGPNGSGKSTLLKIIARQIGRAGHSRRHSLVPHRSARHHWADGAASGAVVGFRRVNQQLTASLLIGAGLLVDADRLPRMVILPYEIPVGLFAALIGAPYVIWLLTAKESPQ